MLDREDITHYWKFFLEVLAFLVMMGLLWLAIFGGRPADVDKVEVPNVVGEKLPEAVGDLNEVGLEATGILISSLLMTKGLPLSSTLMPRVLRKFWIR